jgi:hypothetical protein
MFNANIPALSQNFLRLIDMRAAVVRLTVLSAMLLAVSSPATFAQSAGGGSPVSMRQFEYIDPHEGGRHLALAVFYPAIRDAAPPFVMPFFAKLNLYKVVPRVCTCLFKFAAITFLVDKPSLLIVDRCPRLRRFASSR